MVAVVSSNPPGGNIFFYFLKPSMSILYRNVRFVLKTKNPAEQDLGHKNTVNTYLFYQVCKVHDIVCFRDQYSNADKSWHLNFKHFYLKLVSQLNFLWKIWQRFGNDVVTIQDTSFGQKCLKLRYHSFFALEYWSLKQTMSFTLHTW